ncbi:hypothetical protein ABE504_18350 [Paenibacillus oryzisoli]|uniref:hypothetical protein n=1 Tax=Paenibacillus oryzisoli TaxID=1850517 RepID=UPI003D2BE8D3
MKKRFGFTILFLIVIGSLYFWGSMKLNFSPRYFYTLVTKDTNLSNENINGLKLHQSMKDDWFIVKYGTEYERKENALFDYYELNDGLMVATQKGNDKIIRISMTTVNTQPLRTNKGIGIGESIDKVKQLYGGSYYTRWEQGSSIIGYVDGKETLEFWYAQNEVDQIRYDVASKN